MILKPCGKAPVGRHNRERGITGIETAIILVAFVIVTTVFSYAVLSAGIFATEKSKQAVYTGLEEAQSAVKMMGEVIAKDADADGYVETVTFTIANVIGGLPVDLRETADSNGDGLLSDEAARNHSMILQYSDGSQFIDNIAWTKRQLGWGNDDDLLDAEEKMMITADLTAAGDVLSARRKFTIEVIMPGGACFTIERVTPPAIKPVMVLRTSEGGMRVGG